MNPSVYLSFTIIKLSIVLCGNLQVTPVLQCYFDQKRTFANYTGNNLSNFVFSLTALYIYFMAVMGYWVWDHLLALKDNPE